MEYNRKAFKKINNPKDLRLIRIFVKERLKSKGIKTINGKRADMVKNKVLEQKYWEVFATSPTVDYLERKRLNKDFGRAGKIYFAGNRDFGLVKIALATDVDEQVAELSKQCPFDVEVFTVVDGDVSVEKELMNEFKHLRVNSDWFRLKGELEGMLKKMKN